VLPGRDFFNNDADATDDLGYGTSEASLIAGRGNDGAGIAGICWACKILPVKVVGADGRGPDSGLVAGIVYAADQGAKIINVTVVADGPSQSLLDAVTYAQRKGALLIAPAGNQLSRFPVYPAAYPGVISVGGTDTNSEPFILCYSGFCTGTNYGPEWVDVAAPYCTTALSIDPDDEGYNELFCGTGAATSLVSGTVALLKSKYPTASASALAYSLTSGARPTNITDFTAHGEIRAGTSIRTVDVTAPKVTGAAPAQNSRFRGTVTVTATGVSDTGSGLAYADLYANGRYVGRDTTAPYAVRYASGKSNGTVKLQWRVYDRAGNSAAYDRNLIADNKAPTVKITSAPKNGAKVKGTVTVKASAGDASGIARVELLINGKVVAKDTTAAYSFKIKVSKYGKKLKVQLRAVDKAGNTATTPARTWKR
jgi:archaellum component FlaF (FlaF/FlaG flagellin family)